MHRTDAPAPTSSIQKRMADEYRATAGCVSSPTISSSARRSRSGNPRKSGRVLAHLLTFSRLVTVVILIVVVAFVGFRMTSPEDRERHLQAAKALVSRPRAAALRGQPEADAVRGALRERLPRALVTLLFAALMAVFTLLGDPARLGNTALRTTNGEWWRLVTAIFVQASILQLLINAAILTQVGFI